MDWVSFDEIKKTVSLETVIHHYGIPLRRVGSNTLRGKCPLPSHSSKESRESFTATLTRHRRCWACQSQSCIKSHGRVGGNVLDFVAAMEQCSVRDAAIKLQTWFLVPAAGNSHARNGGKEPHAEISAGKEPEPELAPKETNGEAVGKSECNKPLDFQLQKIDHAHPYLKERESPKRLGVNSGSDFFRERDRCKTES